MNLASGSGDHVFNTSQVDQQMEVFLMGLNERMEEGCHVDLHPAAPDPSLGVNAEAEKRDRLLRAEVRRTHLILRGLLFFHVEVAERCEGGDVVVVERVKQDRLQQLLLRPHSSQTVGNILHEELCQENTHTAPLRNLTSVILGLFMA